MNFNDIKVRLRGLEGRLLEDGIYKVVWEEIERGEMDPISQARAVEDGDGEDGKIKSHYIKHRVRRLNDELATQSTTSSAANKKKRTSHGGFKLQVQRLH